MTGSGTSGRRSRLAFRFLTASALLSLASCFDLREEVWIERDGSGRAELTCVVPAQALALQGGETALRRRIEEALATSGTVRDSSLTVTRQGKDAVVRVEARFDSVKGRSMVGMESAPFFVRHMAGDIRVGVRGRTIDFSRVVSAGKAVPGARFLPAAQTRGRSLEYRVHLPVTATTSNATRTEDGGKTLIWHYPLEQALREPVALSFTAKAPLPRRLFWGLAAGSLLAAGAVGWRKISGWRARQGARS